MSMEASPQPATLNRTIGLPLLVFYGLGVTVGAGIFALIGEILRMAGDKAPLSFLLAGLIAGATGLSYALLVRIFPRAGGEAVFITAGLGEWPGRIAGYGVVATAIISSAVIAKAFAGYAGTLIPLPAPLLAAMVVLLMALIAWWGVRESVMAAAAITILEVGALLVIAIAGAPVLADGDKLAQAFTPSFSPGGMTPVIAGAVIAFFAFIGFEDIENMAEETLDPAKTAPRAIFLTLFLTVFIYVALAAIATLSPARQEIAASPAPMAVLFESMTGQPAGIVAAIAAIAMVNGILVQIMMAARVLYGMANIGLIPPWFAHIDNARRTPARSTGLVAALIVALALFFPLVGLAEATSLVTLLVFAMVNLALFRLGGKAEHPGLRHWRWWGVFAAAICFALAGWQIVAAT